MTLLLILALIAIIFVGVAGLFSGEPSEEKTKNSYSYKRKDFLMSRAEHEFFNALMEIVGDKYYVFPQVHLDEIIYPQKSSGDKVFAFRHINQKSVDFVICDKAYIKPLLAIELDDRSHEREDRKERDGEVERILEEAGMPLLRFGNNGHFDKDEIRRLIFEKIK